MSTKTEPDAASTAVSPQRIVVVGASAAGLAVVEAARTQGFGGELVLIGDESHLPYDRPPLSKQLLTGEWETERLILREKTELEKLNVDLRLGVRATGLDTAQRQVVLAGDQRVSYDALVIATGVRARRLPGTEGIAGVHVLRDLDDALGLRAGLRADGRLVVIGAGVLGVEAAAVARDIGMQVTVVDPLPRPMARVVPEPVGHWLAALHQERGVDMRLSSPPVKQVHSKAGQVTSVELADGTVLPADSVLVAIGANPSVDWLTDTQIAIGAREPATGSGGVLCDARGMAAPGVWAAGDVAAWYNQATGENHRYEHRLNASEQGRAVAKSILDPDFTPPASVPYFWSDQYGLKYQAYGIAGSDDEFVVVEGSLTDNRFVGLTLRDGLVQSALCVGMPRQLRGWRPAVVKHSPWKENTPS
ncbi:NAD(P)/FAD-dependent oxidoreductase [Streptomyces sp. KL116D]|uniref:NAD(P)/FAD-dependent oxidoreductase n=1 Tax=Streptomyces sp. KL116D TaxID=3045152 RepID=UPI0035581866